jgi:hypothetical protein
VRPEGGRLAPARHPVARLATLVGEPALELALDVLGGQPQRVGGRLGLLVTDQVRAERAELDAQVDLDAPLILVPTQRDRRRRRRVVTEAPAERLETPLDPARLEEAQRQAAGLDRGRQAHLAPPLADSAWRAWWARPSRLRRPG